MKRLTREERRRLQRRSANIRFVAFILVLLAIGATIGYAAGRAQATQEPRTGSEVSTDMALPAGYLWRNCINLVSWSRSQRDIANFSSS